LRASPLGKLLLSFSACFALAAILFNSVSWMFVTIVLVSLFVYGRLRLVAETEELDIEVRREVLEDMIYAKEKATIKVEILNKGFNRVKGEIEELLPEELVLVGGMSRLEAEIARRGIFSFSYSVLADKRGEYVIKGIRLHLSDLFGLNQDTIAIDFESTVVVHTERDILETARRLSQREHLRFVGPARNPAIALKEFEFDSIREYIPGDKARDILWKALPKLDELLTKIYRKESVLRTIILLDCSRSMRLSADETSMLDHGIDLTLQIARVLLSGLQPTGVVLFDEVSIIGEVMPGTGKHQFDGIVSLLKQAPASIRISGSTEAEKQPGPAVARAVVTGTETGYHDKEFIRALGHLADSDIVSSSGIGIDTKIRQVIAKNLGSKLLFIVISDLISSGKSILSMARICQKTNNVLITIHTYADWYSALDEGLEKEMAEKLYENLMTSISLQAKLERFGAYYLRIGPADTTSRIIKTIRRTA